MSLVDRLRNWWNKDTLGRADDETRMTEHERDLAAEDFEARKDDVAVHERYGALEGADFERDSEPPAS